MRHLARSQHDRDVHGVPAGAAQRTVVVFTRGSVATDQRLLAANADHGALLPTHDVLTHVPAGNLTSPRWAIWSVSSYIAFV